MKSLLFVPGTDPKKFEKALTIPADVLILDLEDSVAASRKAEARQCVAGFLRSGASQNRLWVRINAFDTGETLADLATIMPGAPAGIVLPKCENRDNVKRLCHYLDAFEAASGITGGSTRIIAIATETAASLGGLGGYRGCSPRLAGLMWGAEDLAASLGASANRKDGSYHGPFALARDLCLIGAAAAGVAAIDAVWTQIKDLEGLRLETEQGKRDGFAAKAVIHPAHVEIVNDVFTPSAEEVTRARRIVEAFALSDNTGVISLDGAMLDKPHLRMAEKILSQVG